ncbi:MULTISPECIES: YggT family protein [Corynebacterium]|uniref:YggT family protein n=1 Tax=Corynebacterium TaxID=1716 RepID=UPI00195931E4|nr:MULTISPECIES: YggT family protein [Corynebacterium]MDN8625054.1 YggT family protein [Corynebacterium kroppenstedtii]QRQ64812.1 YggT family protein [Corynebacterium kroppenstedtii]
MTALSLTIYTIARIYSFILVVRIVVEMIASFSRSWRPPRWFALVAEPFFVVTDPPVKALRKLIPPLNLGGGVGLDLSVLVLFFALEVIAMIFRPTGVFGLY